MTAKICKALGTVWLRLAPALIIFGYGSILFFEGWDELQEIASPLNIWNDIAVAITLGPGLILLQLSEPIARKKATTIVHP
jgi:hypothetical protein